MYLKRPITASLETRAPGMITMPWQSMRQQKFHLPIKPHHPSHPGSIRPGTVPRGALTLPLISWPISYAAHTRGLSMNSQCRVYLTNKATRP